MGSSECGSLFFFFQAEGGIRDLCLYRGFGDVCGRQVCVSECVSNQKR